MRFLVMAVATAAGCLAAAGVHAQDTARNLAASCAMCHGTDGRAVGGNEPLADSVNHLLVVGFYLMNIGYVTLALKYGVEIANAREAIETFSTKIGLVLMVLGVMHFFNLLVFSRMRRRALLHKAPPPVPPTAHLNPVNL